MTDKSDSVPHAILGQTEVRVGFRHQPNPQIEVHYGPTGTHLLSLTTSEARRLAYVLLAEAQEIHP